MEKDFDIEIKKYLTNGAKLNSNYNLENVPNTNGIYIVECPDGVEPEFMDETISIKIYKGKPTEKYTAEELQIKYDNGNKRILYIGEGAGEKGIQSRISKLLKRGFKKKKQHQGGKELWQIKNIENMNIYWYPIENAREKEHELLIQHSIDYPSPNGMGIEFSYPLANWKS